MCHFGSLGSGLLPRSVEHVRAAVIQFGGALPIGVLRRPFHFAETRQAEQAPHRAVKVAGTEHARVLAQDGVAIPFVDHSAREIVISVNYRLLTNVCPAAVRREAKPPAARVAKPALNFRRILREQDDGQSRF